MPAPPSDLKLSIPDLAGKAVLITGGSTGIGAALVRAFAALGSRVALHYNASGEAAEALARELGEAGGEVVLVRGDVSVSADVERIVEEAAGHFGRLDGLINNAGSMVGRLAYSEMTDEHYEP